MNNLKYVGIIPARYASSRFPGKPLAKICGKIMIQRVWEQVRQVLPEVYVATDDTRIYDAVEAFGGKAIMTSSSHRSGTDRCYEALTKIKGDVDVVINIQGDEPFIQPEQIEAIMGCFDDGEAEIATLVREFDSNRKYGDLEDVTTPKVVLDRNMNAIYFSRSVIPFVRNREKKDWAVSHHFYTHIGMYAYRAATLGEITALQPTSLEIAESLEQLRWIENGYKIRVGISNCETIGIDTEEDLKRAEEQINMHKI